MLAQSVSPKIVFIGGSNLSMGLDSKKIADTLKMPVVNSSIVIWPGLKFMINTVKPYVKKGDIIVISAEYSCYDNSVNRSGFEGYEALLAMVHDIFPKGRSYIDRKQWIHLAKTLPHYTLISIKHDFSHLTEAVPDEQTFRKQFNVYGDLSYHWTQAKVPFEAEDKLNGTESLNPDVIPFLKAFNKYVTDRGAKLIMMPPPIQDTSFRNQYPIIRKIQTALSENGIPLIADPARYEFADSFCNDHAYHLKRPGIAIRTHKVIEDLKRVISKN